MDERRRILGSGVGAGPGHPPAWEVREVSSPVTCKASPDGEGLAKLAGKPHGHGRLPPSHSVTGTHPSGHFHIKEPQGDFRRSESAGVLMGSMVFCDEAWKPALLRRQRACGRAPEWERRADFF